MSLPADTSVYTGFWINWSRGRVLGSTITLSQRYGGLLTAFLGIFVTVAGAACWLIQSFFIHQYRAKNRPHSAMHHQQQVVLRNSNTAGSAAWQITQIAWRWRKTTRQSKLQSLSIVLLAVSNMVLFGIAGVFSAEVTEAVGTETLIQSPNCGYLMQDPTDRPDLSAFDTVAGLNAMEANDTRAASAYSRACYGNALSTSQCRQYPKPNIGWTNKTNAPCPFKGNICKDGVGGYEMDTGLIDSLETLGINSKASERVQFRKFTSCSVIRTKEYSFDYNLTDITGELQQLIRYNYTSSSGDGSNYTYQYNKHNVVGLNTYSLTSYGFLGNPSPFIADSQLIPDPQLIPELNLSNADVTLMFLAPNSVTYNSPVLDPLYRATFEINLTDYDGKSVSQYTSDYWVSVLACADRFQIINPANGLSTSLSSSSSIADEAGSLQLTKLQWAMVLGLYHTIHNSITYFSVHTGGGSSLRASDVVIGSDISSPGLPDNQWQIEATDMFSVSMAKLQQQVIGYATGPTYFHEGFILTPGDKELCQRQKIRGVSGYLSFSVLGVSIILSVGFLFIVTALILDTAVGFFRQTLDRNDHKRLQWAADEKLQLQRMAFEEAGQGEWTGGMDAVPMMGAGRLIGLGPEPNKHHPRLSSTGNHSGNSEIVNVQTELLKGIQYPMTS